jgi:hypothetical protein
MQGIVFSKRAAAPTHTAELIQMPQKLRFGYLGPVPSALPYTFILPATTDAKFRRIRRPKNSGIFIGRKKLQVGKTVPPLLTEKNARMRLSRST